MYVGVLAVTLTLLLRLLCIHLKALCRPSDESTNQPLIS